MPTIRVSRKTHQELIKKQGKLQMKTGEKHSLEDVMKKLLENKKGGGIEK